MKLQRFAPRHGYNGTMVQWHAYTTTRSEAIRCPRDARPSRYNLYPVPVPGVPKNWKVCIPGYLPGSTLGTGTGMRMHMHPICMHMHT